MYTAKEALVDFSISSKVREPLMEKIYQTIRDAANVGNRIVSFYDFPNAAYNPAVVGKPTEKNPAVTPAMTSVISELSRMGFMVKINLYPSETKLTSRVYLTISF